jgi:hypothetical protein
MTKEDPNHNTQWLRAHEDTGNLGIGNYLDIAAWSLVISSGPLAQMSKDRGPMFKECPINNAQWPRSHNGVWTLGIGNYFDIGHWSLVIVSARLTTDH